MWEGGIIITTMMVMMMMISLVYRSPELVAGVLASVHVRDEPVHHCRQAGVSRCKSGVNQV